MNYNKYITQIWTIFSTFRTECYEVTRTVDYTEEVCNDKYVQSCAEKWEVIDGAKVWIPDTSRCQNLVRSIAQIFHANLEFNSQFYILFFTFRKKLNATMWLGKDTNPRKNATKFPTKIAKRFTDKGLNKLFALKYHWYVYDNIFAFTHDLFITLHLQFLLTELQRKRQDCIDRIWS